MRHRDWLVFIVCTVLFGALAWYGYFAVRSYRDFHEFRLHLDLSPNEYANKDGIPFEPTLLGKVLPVYRAYKPGDTPPPGGRDKLIHPLFYNLPADLRATSMKELGTIIDVSPPGPGGIQTTRITLRVRTGPISFTVYEIAYKRKFASERALLDALMRLPRGEPKLIQELPSYLRPPLPLQSKPGEAPTPYRSGKILVINLRHKSNENQFKGFIIIDNAQWLLPRDLMATRPEDVATVIWLEPGGTSVTAKYTNLSEGGVSFLKYTIINNREWKTVATGLISSSGPPDTVSGFGSHFSVVTDEEVLAFLESLPLQNAP